MTELEQALTSQLKKATDSNILWLGFSVSGDKAKVLADLQRRLGKGKTKPQDATPAKT